MNFNKEEKKQLFELFKNESNQIIEIIRNNLILLQQNQDLLDVKTKISQNLHKLKSCMGSVNFNKLRDLVHNLETVFSDENGSIFYQKMDFLNMSLNFIEMTVLNLENLDEIISDMSFYNQLMQISDNFSKNNIWCINFDKNDGSKTDFIKNLNKTLMPADIECSFALVHKLLENYVNQTAINLGKKVSFTLIDKNQLLTSDLMKKIQIPLFHLINNSISHGIESELIRKKFDKPLVGKITIKIKKENEKIVIEFIDDGKGFDIDEIREIGLKKGILTSNELTKMTEEQILNLVFLPNFSTENNVTTYSGRGFGLNTIKSDIENLNGSIKIFSKQNEGSCIKIEIS